MADESAVLQLMLLNKSFNILRKSSVVMSRIVRRVSMVPEILKRHVKSKPNDLITVGAYNGVDGTVQFSRKHSR